MGEDFAFKTLVAVRDNLYNGSWQRVRTALQTRLDSQEYLAQRTRDVLERDTRHVDKALADERNGKFYYSHEGTLYTVLIPTRKNGQGVPAASQA